MIPVIPRCSAGKKTTEGWDQKLEPQATTL